MPATPIVNPEPSESLVGIEPPLLQQVNAGWRHRLNLFTGRILSANALQSEQLYRSGLLATLGQLVTPGIVSGLTFSIDASVAADPLLTVTPGYGIAASGEDVVLLSLLQTHLSTLAVIDSATGAAIIDPKTLLPASFGTYAANSADQPAGVFVLQPIVAQASGQTFDTSSAPQVVSGNLTASCDQDPQEYAFEDWQIADGLRLVFVPWPNALPSLPLASANAQPTYRNRLVYGIFDAEAQLAADDVLPWLKIGVPVALVAFDVRGRSAWASGTPYSAGQVIADPTGKLQQVQTAGISGNTAPAWNETFGQTTTDNTVTWLNIGSGSWQAATAYVAGQSIVDSNGYVQTVTSAGTSGSAQPAIWNDTLGQTTSDASVVWTNGGLAWRALFIDRSAVVRAGGLPRRRNVVPVDSLAAQIVGPALAQSRILQLSDQINDQLALEPNFNSLASIATSLPPCGVLPPAALDLTNKKNRWLPGTWKILAAPIHLQELEAALQSGMFAAPLDPAAAEEVEVLVPLPDAVYDPDILVTETVAADFQSELDRATAARNVALRARKTIQLEFNVLQTVLGPNAPAPNPNVIDLNAGLTADEESGRDGLPPYWPQPAAKAGADQTFGARGPATWQPATAYAAGQIVIDSNGNFERVQTAGVSGAALPVWMTSTGQITTDGAGLTWLNAGSGQWRADVAFAAGQFIFDANGSVQTVQTAGTSGASQYHWNATLLQTTADNNVTWRNAGPRAWQANTKYAAGQAVIDSNGNAQAVQTEGTSGTGAAWGTDTGELTPDGGVIWLYEGLPTVWARDTVYRVGQFIVDPNGNIQETVAIAGDGSSGASEYIWSATAGATTTDGGVTWVNGGPGVWQPATAYAAGQFIIDANGNLQTVKTAGTSGTAAPAWSTAGGGVTADGGPNAAGAAGLTWVAQVWASVDVLALQTAAAARPYTLSWPAWQANTVYAVGQIATDSNGNLQVVQTAGTSGAAAPSAWGTAAGAVTADGSTLKWAIVTGVPAQIPLISTDDWTDLATNGLQHFIDRLNAKINKANDLIDLAFLTTQTDIYRFRQNVLGATDASRLATSPILANIATGVTATGTAQNLQDYFTSILPKPAPTPPTPATTPAATTGTIGVAHAGLPVSTDLGSAVSAGNVGIVRAQLPGVSRVASLTQTIGLSPVLKLDPSSAISKTITLTGTSAQKLYSSTVLATVRPVGQLPAITPAPAQPTASDVQGQSPIAGAQLDIRTVTIAERLAQPVSQESLFYAVGNRTALMQTLVDLEITVDDIPFLVDAAPATSATIPTETHFVAELRSASTAAGAFNKILNPYVPSDSDEAGMFSSGVRVLEQHTQLLRALEGRVQTYVDFVSLCTTTIGSIQSDVARAQTALTGLDNTLVQARQDLAFTAALLADERQRVDGVNAQRNQILQTSVGVVVYTRPRTLDLEDDVPSRQLMPGSVANPVPAALQQSIPVPPELREITALLQEVPLSWLPSVAPLMRRLDRPILLQQIAVSTQARAALQLKLPLPQSSALLTPSVYASTIANVYGANQQLVRSLQAERAAFVPAQLTNLSWSSQVSIVTGITTIADLASSIAVHAEIASAVALAQQQIASVATSIYARANLALPADRLAWAEYLRGPGLTVQLQNLSVLPNWNTQSYVDRQQMQMLVDWLFAQIDSAQTGAAAYMSDVIRVSILLASHAPVNDVIAGAVTVRTQPVIGKVVSLNLPSARVASGMYVQLYSKGNLAAEAVVNDLDSTSVSATVTSVHQQGVYLEPNDVAHFTTQPSRAAALRAFSV